MDRWFESITQQLVHRSIAVEDKVLEADVPDILYKEAVSDFEKGLFKEAHIGKGVEKQRISEMRGDSIRWWDKTIISQSQLAYWSFVDGLQVYLSEFFRIHLTHAELHFAVYPAGAFYARHVDQFKGNSSRVFSVILYLNPGWKKGDGGELRVYHQDGTTEDIEPRHGRFVCFRSDLVEHEVLETRMQRVSVTGWVRRDEIR